MRLGRTETPSGRFPMRRRNMNERSLLHLMHAQKWSASVLAHALHPDAGQVDRRIDADGSVHDILLPSVAGCYRFDGKHISGWQATEPDR